MIKVVFVSGSVKAAKDFWDRHTGIGRDELHILSFREWKSFSELDCGVPIDLTLATFVVLSGGLRMSVEAFISVMVGRRIFSPDILTLWLQVSLL